MMLNPRHEEGFFYLLAAIGGLVSAVGIGAALYMEHSGHVVTGMDNQIVWGMPHVFADLPDRRRFGRAQRRLHRHGVRRKLYKARAPLSGLLALAMISRRPRRDGMLDLGRADRIIVADDALQLQVDLRPGT
jgi:hypothetical protein